MSPMRVIVDQLTAIKKKHQYKNIRETYLKCFLLFCFVARDNSITTCAHHSAVPREDILWLQSFMQDNKVPFEKAIHILRRTYFPFNYDPYPWIPGMSFLHYKLTCLQCACFLLTKLLLSNVFIPVGQSCLCFLEFWHFDWPIPGGAGSYL